MRAHVFILAILLMAGIVSANWSENIAVYVIGWDGRGLSNATVDVVYQILCYHPHATIEKQTDNFGMTTFTFGNNMQDEGGAVNLSCVEYSYNIIASDAGFTNSTEGSVYNPDKNYFVMLPLLQRDLTILDSSNRPLSDAVVTVASTSFVSDSNGMVYFSLPIGMASNISVSYGDIEQTLSINPSSSNVTTVSLPIYDLKVLLFDEQGNRINGTVSFGGISELSTIESPAMFPHFSEASATFDVRASGKEKMLTSNITSDTLDIYFDLTPPAIRNVETTVTSKNSLAVTAAISDDGAYASGLASNPTLSYSLGSGYIGVEMFPASVNTFQTTIPANGENVSFTITAVDNQNNSNYYYGTYNFEGTSVKAQKPTLQIEPVQFIGVLIFVVLVIFIYQRIKQQS